MEDAINKAIRQPLLTARLVVQRPVRSINSQIRSKPFSMLSRTARDSDDFCKFGSDRVPPSLPSPQIACQTAVQRCGMVDQSLPIDCYSWLELF